MTRNFGLSSPRHVGAKTIPGAPASRVAVSREPIQLAGKTSRPANSRGANPESFITLDDAISAANTKGLDAERFRVMERAAKFLLIGMAAFIGAFFCAALWVVSLVIDYGLSDSPF